MVHQPELDLHTPLNREIPATIRRTKLTPRLALSALTLHGDFYRQLQSKANSRIFWHPLTQLFMISVLGLTAVYQYSDLWRASNTWSEFGSLMLNNKYLVSSIFPSLIFVAGTVGLTSFLLTDEIRVISDKLGEDSYQQKLFGFPLKVFANATSEEAKRESSIEFMESAEFSTELIEYRESPVAVVTVLPEPELSSKDVFYAKITGFHVRKSYKTAGLENELLDIAAEKAQVLSLEYIKKRKLKADDVKVVLLVDAYALDPINRPIVEKKGFEIKSSTTQLDPFAGDDVVDEKLMFLIPHSMIKRFFGVFRHTYELEVSNESSATASGATSSSSKVTSRKRKA
ncbi:hypothetical protein FT663_03467 [Candidozyma haemuli var. vulneris]|nr:hypothetical protein FT662_03532 [[Candida] haemuloni var. vulneris]KAF3989806.1 hypothetical protein FT663_03467 [[Candida] haemuloni var. vulneris]